MSVIVMLSPEVRGVKAVVVLLVDLLDASGTMLSKVRDMVGNNPIVLVGTKMDLLPPGCKPKEVAEWLAEAAARKRLVVTSSHLGRDLFVVGAANVGKSAFVRALLKEMSSTALAFYGPNSLRAVGVPLLEDGQEVEFSEEADGLSSDGDDPNVAVSGLPGWVAVAAPYSKQDVVLRVWAPRGVEVFLRPPLPCPPPPKPQGSEEPAELVEVGQALAAAEADQEWEAHRASLGLGPMTKEDEEVVRLLLFGNDEAGLAGIVDVEEDEWVGDEEAGFIDEEEVDDEAAAAAEEEEDDDDDDEEEEEEQEDEEPAQQGNANRPFSDDTVETETRANASGAADDQSGLDFEGAPVRVQHATATRRRRLSSSSSRR
eukprot:gene9693-9851_t